ncbi:hypothetical protein BASA81_005161 [Batrachochytrium salamandrivorans]|nr:hypothetical protein BASA81_005161 [Batrachochytrium salamandrivorans]
MAWEFAEVETTDAELASGEVHCMLLDLDVCAHTPCLELIKWDGTSLFITLDCFSSSRPNTEVKQAITLDTQILVTVNRFPKPLTRELCYREFVWSRQFPITANEMILLEGGRGNKTKTLLMDCLLAEHRHTYWFTAEDVWLYATTNDAARRLGALFQFASNWPSSCAIVLDALDALFPSDGSVDQSLLLTLVMELTKRSDKVLVVAICDQTKLLHPYLLALFSQHIVQFRSPNSIGEWEDFFFDRVLDGDNVASQDTVLAIAACQHNLSLAQVLTCFVRGNFSQSRFDQLVADQVHFPPSIKLPFTFIPRPMVPLLNPFAKVGGHAEAKQILIEALEWPLLRRREMLELGIIKPIRGVLLCGPPGAGKTLLARAASQGFAYNFLSVSVSDLIRGNVGQSEQRVSDLFALARTCQPCIVFFDECHALFATKQNLGPSGQKVLSQFLVEMDHLGGTGIVLLAATNEERMVDPSLIGRFDRVVSLQGLSSLEDFSQVLHTCISDLSNPDPFSTLDVNLVAQLLVDQAPHKYTTGASIAQLLFRASLYAIEEDNRSITPQDVVCAMLEG